MRVWYDSDFHDLSVRYMRLTYSSISTFKSSALHVQNFASFAMRYRFHSRRKKLWRHSCWSWYFLLFPAVFYYIQHVVFRYIFLFNREQPFLPSVCRQYGGVILVLSSNFSTLVKDMNLCFLPFSCITSFLNSLKSSMILEESSFQIPGQIRRTCWTRLF